MATSRMSAAARMNVLLEEVRTQNRATYEGLMGAIESLERKMDRRLDRIEQRLDLLEHSVETLFNEVAELRSEVNELRTEVRQLRHDFDHREERERLDAIERRIEALEKRRPH